MQTLELKAYRHIVVENQTYTAIYAAIKKAIEQNRRAKVDFTNVLIISPSFAKQVFGKLYIELGANRFSELIKVTNANDKIDLLIRVQIQNAIDEKCYRLVW